jgi:hypothetical protein
LLRLWNPREFGFRKILVSSIATAPTEAKSLSLFSAVTLASFFVITENEGFILFFLFGVIFLLILGLKLCIAIHEISA